MGNAVKVLTRVGLSDALNNIKPGTAMQLKRAIHNLEHQNMLELETKGIIKRVTHNNNIADGVLYSYPINRHAKLLFTKKEHVIKIITVEDSSNKRKVTYH